MEGMFKTPNKPNNKRSRISYEKSSHNVVSQRGRAKINEQIEQLKALLPECGTSAVNKAVKMIERSQLCIALFRHELSVEMAKNAHLRLGYEQTRLSVRSLKPLDAPITAPDHGSGRIHIKEELGQSDQEFSFSSELGDSSQNSPTGYNSPLTFTQGHYAAPQYPSPQVFFGLPQGPPPLQFEPPTKRPRIPNLIEPRVMEDEERRLQNESMGLTTLIQPLQSSFDGPIIENIRNEPPQVEMTEIIFAEIVEHSDNPTLKI